MVTYFFGALFFTFYFIEYSSSQFGNNQEIELGSYSNLHKKIPTSLFNQFPAFSHNANSGLPNRDLKWDTLPSMTQNQNLHLNLEASKFVNGNGLRVVPDWPDSRIKLGQLSAVSLDRNENVVVFHRGDRIWSSISFNVNNVYNEVNQGPIPQNTIVVINASNGLVIEEWGSHMFYLPHGLTVDFENNIWVTDVALHQVFKFSSSDKQKPLLELGTKFVPGNDDHHFCKPTDVAVLTSGDFFVSDGYCNSRILKYDKKGSLLMQVGRHLFQGYQSFPSSLYSFSVPHALALAEEQGLLFLADRENGRILSFNITSGTALYEIKSSEMGSRIFSVAYSPSKGGQLYAVNGPSGEDEVGGFKITLGSGQSKITKFNLESPGLKNPHDVAVTKDGSKVYVVELNPFRVWKFTDGLAVQSLPLQNEVAVSLKLNQSVNSVPTSSGGLITKKEPMKTVGNSTFPQVTKVGSIAVVIGTIVGVFLIVCIVLVAVIARMRKRGCLLGYSSHHKRWDFPISPVEGFKLGQFLDRHQGFEKVSTEESDDEASGSSSTHKFCNPINL